MMTSKDIKIDRLKPTDAQAAIDLLTECFGGNMSDAAHADVEASLSNYRYAPVSIVAKLDNQPVGFIQVITAFFHVNIYAILWLSVLPVFRKQGIARRLMEFAENFVIETRFKGAPGSFILTAEYDKKYYENQGYIASGIIYDGTPLMIKNVLPVKQGQ